MATDYTAAFQALEGRLQEGAPAWLGDRRKEALARFEALGLPSTRLEDWRHTSLRVLGALDLDLTPAAGGEVRADLPRIEGAARVVFVDGTLVAQDALPEGVRVLSLRQAMREAPDLLERWLGRAAKHEDRAMTALNLALMWDGLVVHVARKVVVDRPIHVVFEGTRPRHAVHLRHLIVAEPSSQVLIVEEYVGGAADQVENVVTEVIVEANAEVRHVKLQHEAATAYHLASIDARVERDARFRSSSLATGAAIGRTEVRVALAAEGAEAELLGLTMARGSQHLDHTTVIDHAVPHGRSVERYKGILDDRARSVFNGLVRVHPDAQKTDSQMTNDNLVLSEDAVANTRPQLEIHADDVKCSHGTTIGQLDDEQLFYLRSRGIGEAEAKALLMRAFAQDVVDRVPEAAVRARVEAVVGAWLEGT